MFTKQHYEIIANIIRDLSDYENNINRDDLMEHLADYFEKDNENFDRDKFYHKCCQSNLERNEETIKEAQEKYTKGVKINGKVVNT